MPQFHFKCNLNIFRDSQLEFISKVLKNKGFAGSEVSIENVGDGFMANVKRVTVEENGKIFRMIVKIAPTDEMFRKMTSTDTTFKNEHVIYTQLLPKFATIQNSRELEEDIFRHAAHFGSFLEECNELLLLEDLEENRYTILDQSKPLTNETVKLVLKNFAVFHSLSFVLKSREPEWFEAIKGNLDEPIKDIELTRIYFRHLEETILKSLDNDKYKCVVKGIANFPALLEEMTEKVFGSPYSVIQHGDGWTNNFMLKVEANRPVKCAMIDYQLAKENSPVYDIMYMIFNSTTHEQRMAHYHEFIDHYHCELDRSLRHYAMRACDVYPRKQLDIDMKIYAKIILMRCIHVSFLVAKNVYDAEKDAPSDYNDAIEALIHLNSEAEAFFKGKIEGIVDSFLGLGLL